MKDIGSREFWLLGIIALAVLFMGVWPKPFIDVMHTSVTELLTVVGRSKL
jgi:NADH-quinone oxidoreductase subunit M